MRALSTGPGTTPAHRPGCRAPGVLFEPGMPRLDQDAGCRRFRLAPIEELAVMLANSPRMKCFWCGSPRHIGRRNCVPAWTAYHTVRCGTCGSKATRRINRSAHLERRPGRIVGLQERRWMCRRGPAEVLVGELVMQRLQRSRKLKRWRRRACGLPHQAVCRAEGSSARPAQGRLSTWRKPQGGYSNGNEGDSWSPMIGQRLFPAWHYLDGSTRWGGERHVHNSNF